MNSSKYTSKVTMVELRSGNIFSETRNTLPLTYIIACLDKQIVLTISKDSRSKLMSDSTMKKDSRNKNTSPRC